MVADTRARERRLGRYSNSDYPVIAAANDSKFST
jgi:hypothetical protein